MKKTVDQLVRFRLIESRDDDDAAWCGSDGEFRRYLLQVEFAEDIPENYFEVGPVYQDRRRYSSLQAQYSNFHIIEKVGTAIVDALNTNRTDDRTRAHLYAQRMGQYSDEILAHVVVYFTEDYDDDGQPIPDDDELDAAIDLAQEARRQVSEMIDERVQIRAIERQQAEPPTEAERDAALLALSELMTDFKGVP